MKIYVAASAKEIDRAEYIIAYAIAQGHSITCDWTIDMRRNLAAGRSDADLSRTEARGYASKDLDAVEEADGVLFLSPLALTKGAWVELGFAYGRGKVVVVSYLPFTEPVYTASGRIFSPGDYRPRSSIFEEIAIPCHCGDVAALKLLEEKVG